MNRSTFANLVDVYHLSIGEIGQLTDWQIRHILYHPRKKTGEIEKIKLPEPKIDEAEYRKVQLEEKKEPTLKDNLRVQEYIESALSLENFARIGAIPFSNYQENLKKLQAKFEDILPLIPKNNFVKYTTEEEPIKEEKVIDNAEYEENMKSLNEMLAAGVLKQPQYDESVAKLKIIFQ